MTSNFILVGFDTPKLASALLQKRQSSTFWNASQLAARIVYSEAAEALGTIGNSGARALVSALQSDNKDVVIAAAKALGEMKPGEQRPDALITESLINVLWRKNVDICDAAVAALGRYANTRSVAAIIQSMQDTNIYTSQLSSALALERIGRPCLPQLLDALNKCNTTNDADFATWSCAVLADIGAVESIGALNRIADSEWALPGIQDTKRPTYPMEIIKSDDPLSFWDWTHNRSIASLNRDLKYGGWRYDKHQGIDACAQATYALARIGKPALTNLVTLTRAPTAWGRCRALEGLSLLNIKNPVKEPTAILAIIQRLHDTDEYVQVTARRALKAITGETSIHRIFIHTVYSAVDPQEFADAGDMAEAYEQSVEDDIVQVFSFGSENQRLTYMDTIQGLSHPYCMLEYWSRTNCLARAILHLKGIVLDSLLEDAMARNVASVGQARRALKLTVPEVQGVLEKDAVLLEFVRYNQRLDPSNFEPRYGVVLIGAGEVAFKGAKPGEPVWVPLGSAETIEQSLKEYRAVMRGEKQGEASLLNRLYLSLFDPIQQRLPKGINTLIISPDAELSFVNLATLLDRADKFLGEKYTIKYVSSGRDLVFGRKAGRRTRRLSAFANPAFGEKPGLARTSDTNRVELAMRATDQRDYAGVNLPPLPGTAAEARYLRDKSAGWKLEATVYEGVEASEAEVRAVKSPHILHLATHGFFLPETTPSNQLSQAAGLLDRERMPVVLHNPMQRSGVALAGAQLTLDAWKRGETPASNNDGILMAQEVGSMDLKETWLVVLSACDTGVGEARAGEGVLGLRRGFIQAGAQNLMMTLWPVSDRWTMDMMKAFYERALKDGDAPGALAQVQREYLVKLKEQKGTIMAARLTRPFVMTFQGETSK